MTNLKVYILYFKKEITLILFFPKQRQMLYFRSLYFISIRYTQDDENRTF